MSVTAYLDKEAYDPNEAMTLTVSEDYGPKRTMRVVDSTGAVFTKVSGSDKGQGAVFTGRAGAAHVGVNKITVSLTHLSDGVIENSDPVEYTVGPQASAGGGWIGGSLAGDDGGLDLLADARRAFESGWMPSRFADNGNFVTAARRTAPGGVVWVSYKGTGSQSTLASFVASMNDYLAAINLRGFITYEHEPDIKDGVPTDVYHRGYDILDPLTEAEDNVESIVCLTGFSGDKDPSIWRDYYRENHRRLGADHYNRGMQLSGEKLATPQENWGPLVAFAREVGKRLCIGETGAGTDSTPGAVIKTRADWYRAHRAYALDPDNYMDLACVFDARMTILDSASARAWYAV